MESKFYKYGSLAADTRIFFKGDNLDNPGYGKVVCSVEDGYIISMDNGSSYTVHPILFEEFGGLFQVEEERENKVSWLPVDRIGTVKDLTFEEHEINF